MALNVQNDLGTVTDANAYVTEAEFRAYWVDRNDSTVELDTATVEALIVKATQYIDMRFSYYSDPLNGRDQTTEFPRTEIYDPYCNQVEGVPREIKAACCEYAFYANSAELTNNTTSTERQVVKERDKVDALETEREYQSASSSTTQWNLYQVADNILLKSGFAIQQWGMLRA